MPFKRLTSTIDPRIAALIEKHRRELAEKYPLGVPQSDQQTCPKCNGLKMLKVPVPGGDPWEHQIIDCSCNTAAMHAQRVDRLLGGSGFESDGAREATFDEWPTHSSNAAAWEAGLDYANRPQGWLWLQGAPGVGKTTLALCIGNWLIEQEKPAIFRTVPDLLDQLRETFRDGADVDFSTRWTAMRECNLLILDDFGTESDTPFANEKLLTLINHRWMERIPTIVTTNLTLDELYRRYKRIASRIEDERLCTIINFTGDSE